MAAMQHALPVVGTRTRLTDSFWEEVEGVRLVSRNSSTTFAQKVLELALDPKLRANLGQANQDYYHSHFSWPLVIQTFLGRIG